MAELGQRDVDADAGTLMSNPSQTDPLTSLDSAPVETEAVRVQADVRLEYASAASRGLEYAANTAMVYPPRAVIPTCVRRQTSRSLAQSGTS